MSPTVVLAVGLLHAGQPLGQEATPRGSVVASAATLTASIGGMPPWHREQQSALRLAYSANRSGDVDDFRMYSGSLSCPSRQRREFGPECPLTVESSRLPSKAAHVDLEPESTDGSRPSEVVQGPRGRKSGQGRGLATSHGFPAVVGM